LAAVVDAISKTIRNRISMRRKIRAISSEGRTTAWFLSALPFVMFGFTSYLSPGYYAGVMDDPLFKPMATIVIVLTIVNAIVLKKLVSFRI
jgi:tight adherence protein B